MILDKPYSRESEMAVVGAILIDPSILSNVMSRIKEDYFYFQENRKIFEVMKEMFIENEKVDLLTLKENLKRKKLFDQIGGDNYLNKLTDEVVYVVNIDEYMKIVEEKYVLRHLIETSQNISKFCYSEKNVNEIIDYAENEIFKVQENRYKRDVILIRDKLPEVSRMIEKAQKDKTDVTGVPTGFKDLDVLTTGFHPGEFVVIAARPSVGKTSFALNMLVNACVNQKYSGLLFSLEMTGEQLVQRMVCTIANVSNQKLRQGRLTPADMHNIKIAINELEKAKIYLDDSTKGTPVDVKAKARRVMKEHKLDFIIIDYLQLMITGKRVENRQIEVSQISRALKLLAKELHIPVIALAQLSRNPEKRQTNKPVLSDIRDSGSIEQDADVVIFIHRKFKPKTTLDDATLILAKQRNGPTGDVEILFDLNLTLFKPPTSESF